MFNSISDFIYGDVYHIDDTTSNSGERFVTTYTAALDGDGRLDLVESGQYDLYESIQSHKDSVDIDLMIQRFNNGDISALGNPRPPMYLDVTDFPKSYAEMYQLVIDAKNNFEQLPLEVRDAFGHSPEAYFASFGTDGFNDIMSKFYGSKSDSADVVPSAPSIAVDPIGVDVLE